jgi:hypothetical protein
VCRRGGVSGRGVCRSGVGLVDTKRLGVFLLTETVDLSARRLDVRVQVREAVVHH